MRAGPLTSLPVRDSAPGLTWGAVVATGAVTASVVSAATVASEVRTRRVCKPGVVSVGMTTTNVNAPLASVAVEPSTTGSLNSSATTGVEGGNPVPVTVTF